MGDCGHARNDERIRQVVLLQKLTILFLIYTVIFLNIPFIVNAVNLQEPEDISGTHKISDDIGEKSFQEIDSKMEDQFFANYTNNINRAQFCYLVVTQLSEIKNTTTHDMYDKLTDQQKKAFIDIKDDDVYIALAKKFEIIIGVGDDQFNANSNLTREEAATISANLIRLVAEDHWEAAEDYYSDKIVGDRPEISDWAIDDVMYILDIELMTTDKNDNFDPLGNITVESAVLLISKLRSYVETPIEPKEENLFLRIIKNKIFIAVSIIVIAVPTIVALVRHRNRRRELLVAAGDRIKEDELNQALSNISISIDKREENDQAAYSATLEESEAQKAFNEDKTVSILSYKKKREKKKMIKLAEKNELNTPPYVFNAENVIKIGRHKRGNDLTVRDTTVSGYHCEVYAVGDNIYVRDLDSSNKTIIIRKRKRLVADKSGEQLLSNDVLCLGSAQFDVTLFES